jgi:cytosine/adenosine deaminase-related metal-dependent hydrolase
VVTVHVEGTIVAGDSLEPIRGRVVVEEGRIRAVEECATDSTDVILPAFVNAHTHIGDSVAKEAAVGLSLEEAVVPPTSRKHRRLQAASRQELVTAMRRTMAFMETTGTAAFLDFREFGTEGALVLRDAATEQAVHPFVFGSDDPDVLDVADGYGASGANDSDFIRHREAAQAAGKPFAIHAGEPDATDIHPALDLDPDLLVHMVHAESEHLSRVAEGDIPIAVCPRANLVLGVGSPPLRELLDNTTVALGTDNVMLNTPSMFREMAYTAKAFDVTPREVLEMATKAGATVADLNCGVVESGRDAKLLVLDGDSNNLAGYDDPIAAIVRRASAQDVQRVIL